MVIGMVPPHLRGAHTLTPFEAAEVRAHQVHPDLGAQLARAHELVRLNRADNTARAYDGHWRRFQAQCQQWGVPSRPAGADTVCAYLVHYAETAGVGYSAVDQAAAAIDFHHRAVGHPVVAASPEVRAVRSALQRELARPASNRKEAVPCSVVVSIAQRMLARGDRVSLMLATYVSCSYAGIMRYSDWGEVTLGSLRFSDDGTRACIEVPARKNDQFYDGHLVVFTKGTTEACPVDLLARWRSALLAEDARRPGRPDSARLPLFRSFDGGAYHARLAGDGAAPAPPGPLFSLAALAYPQARYYTLRLLADALAISTAEATERFGTHSLRRGGATDAAARGLSQADITMMGGWRDERTCLRYVARSEEFRAAQARHFQL
jgi:hypothetical protein